jgi:hypothetical protein
VALAGDAVEEPGDLEAGGLAGTVEGEADAVEVGEPDGHLDRRRGGLQERGDPVQGAEGVGDTAVHGGKGGQGRGDLASQAGQCGLLLHGGVHVRLSPSGPPAAGREALRLLRACCAGPSRAPPGRCRA